MHHDGRVSIEGHGKPRGWATFSWEALLVALQLGARIRPPCADTHKGPRLCDQQRAVRWQRLSHTQQVSI
jgi:hypothetical protein